MAKPAVVMDNGTGYTKIGYAGNVMPNHIFPTTVAEPPPKTNRDTLDDLDFYIGKEAVDIVNYTGGKYHQYNPIKHGIVENWDHMEKLWQHSIYKYLRCEPEEHAFMLTESPFNPPENREYTAEIMFETFGVSSLHIAVQAVLALAASWDTKSAKKAGIEKGELSGTVIDSGDGVTHIIPVSHGYVIQSGIKHIRFAGKDITKFIFDIIKEREKTHPDVNMMLECQRMKEQYGYVCKDLSKEFAKYDEKPGEHVTQWSGTVPKTKKPWTIDIGPEKFLGPELFFHPEIFSLEHTTPLPALVDEMIQGCPIDTRKSLYRNIVLSGGSTMFKNFGKRLEMDIKERVNVRLEYAFQKRRDKSVEKQDLPVNVISHKTQEYAVWYGGSVLACEDSFQHMVKTRSEYEEHGPAIFRNSALGGNIFDEQ